jgi:hypothetical protein
MRGMATRRIARCNPQKSRANAGLTPFESGLVRTLLERVAAEEVRAG